MPVQQTNNDGYFWRPTPLLRTGMPLNIPGLLVPFQLLIYPRLVVPALVVKGSCDDIFFPVQYLTVTAQEDIRQIDFSALKRAGYRGAVFDKDNCLVPDNFSLMNVIYVL